VRFKLPCDSDRPETAIVWSVVFMDQIVTHAPPRKGTSWAAFAASFGYAFGGLWYVLRTQRNARVHAAAAVLAIGLGIFLRISPVEFAVTFVAISGVFTAEMFNTALEAGVDLVSPQWHPLAKIAKDVAAGAVLVNAILAVIIGLCIFGPHLWALLVK
jgi:diacylglycerol kinase